MLQGRFKKETVDEIYRHALQENPGECCGVVTGNEDRQTVHRCLNIQNRLHLEDPGAHPRDARTAYAIDRKEMDKIISSANSKDEGILAFYHSHIEHDAYFSETDKAAQTVFGEPEFPEAEHIIVSVRDGKIKEIKSFKWDSNKKDFVSV